MFRNLIPFFIFIIFAFSVNGKTLNIISINEDWVCGVKTSCQECLKHPQCSWCTTELNCFSEQLVDKDFCENGITKQTNISLSLEDNARCACAGDEIVQNCRPPGDSEAAECSGRGSCHCGRCICDVPDPEIPSKVIIGEYCEFDNYSCDSPMCNEGPYSIYELEKYAELKAMDEEKSRNLLRTDFYEDIEVTNPEEQQI
ncbi:integrin beta-like protein 1 [Aricia agestis]|uniref:integrin beta-like protein 1 n=1 Tax=Aricia agestis TaxID=91739 RepID=UPI001C20202D|nr:integrin beta-like protein 1 [Aricia agestis]